VRLWNIQTGRLVERLVGHSQRVTSVAFTSDGKGLVSGSWDHTVKHWDLRPLLRNTQNAVKQSYAVGIEDASSTLNDEGVQNEGACVCTVEFMGHEVRRRHSTCVSFYFLSSLSGLVNLYSSRTVILMGVHIG
jgi:general transcriptional corepressor TUP1